jgi:hypothetical protein
MSAPKTKLKKKCLVVHPKCYVTIYMTDMQQINMVEIGKILLQEQMSGIFKLDVTHVFDPKIFTEKKAYYFKLTISDHCFKHIQLTLINRNGTSLFIDKLNNLPVVSFRTDINNTYKLKQKDKKIVGSVRRRYIYLDAKHTGDLHSLNNLNFQVVFGRCRQNES